MIRVAVAAEQLRRAVPGGIGTYIRGLSRGLDDLDDGLVGFVLWGSRPRRGRPDEIAQLGPAVSSPLPSRALVLAWDIGWSGAAPAADLVHATSLAVPPVRSVPVSAMIHDLAWRRFPAAYPRRGLRWHEAALRRALRRCRLFVTPSAATAGDLMAAGAPASSVEVVEEGSDHLPAADHQAAEALLTSAGVGPTDPFLLTVSTIEPRKNLGRLIEAFERARPHLPGGWPLFVVGPSGWGHMSRLRAEGVHFAGAVDGPVLAALYERAALFVYVPLWEGFGLPAVEAMRAGCPVVASPVPSAAGAALEVDPTDPEAISRAIVQGAGDRGRREELVAAGRQRAAELTWERTARRHVELWQQLAGR